MKKGLLIFLLLISYTGSSQDFEYLKEIHSLQKMIEEERIEDAYEKLKTVIPLAIEIKGNNSETVAQLFHAKGFVCIRLQNIDEAIENLEKAIAITRKINKQNTEFYVADLFVLAKQYSFKRENKKAEKLVDEAVLRIKEMFKIQNDSYYIYLNKAASFYQSLFSYEKVAVLSNEIIAYVETKYGKEIDYVVASKNLAFMYLKAGKKDKGVKILTEILPIASKLEFQIDDSKISVQFMTALAEMSYYLGEDNKAIKYYIKLLKLYKNSQEFNYTSYASCLNSLGQIYNAQGKYEESIKYHRLAIESIVKIKGTKSREYKTIVGNIALVYWKNGQMKEAFDHLQITLKNGIDDILEKHTFMSEIEKETYIKGNMDGFDVFSSFALQQKNNMPTLVNNVYNNALFLKGQLLKSSITLRKTILQSDNEELLSKYNEWISLKKELARTNEKAIGNPKSNIENQINTLEKYLISQSESFKKIYIDNQITWLDVQKKLAANEVAIEFINFKQYNNDWTGENYYCALLLKEDSTSPKMIYLCEEKELSKLLENNFFNSQGYANSVYGTKSEKNRALYNLLWKPLEKQLQDSQKIYFSPSGLLHNISFSALSNGNEFLSTTKNIKRLSSTSKIKPSNFENIKNATLYGGINYGNTSRKWEFLEETANEIKEIAKILKKNNVNVKLFSGKKATEKKLKKTAQKYNILHIATHGFFEYRKKKTATNNVEHRKLIFDNVDSNIIRNGTATTFALRAGLVFAGANDTKNAISGENNILTATEVANLDLRSTILVVLSACETALGDISRGEGVYGLQRSFKMVGVQNIMVSLWKIPDKGTKEFMILFYKNLFMEQDITKAFQQTQNTMSKHYDPYYWAGFILIE